MSGKPSPLSPEALDSVLNALLAEYPAAFVAAINADGLFVPLPGSLPLTGQQVLQARSMFDLVVSEDRDRVISTWDRAADRAVAAEARENAARGVQRRVHIGDKSNVIRVQPR